MGLQGVGGLAIGIKYLVEVTPGRQNPDSGMVSAGSSHHTEHQEL